MEGHKMAIYKLFGQHLHIVPFESTHTPIKLTNYKKLSASLCQVDWKHIQQDAIIQLRLAVQKETLFGLTTS